jgi:hypothetical protein
MKRDVEGPIQRAIIEYLRTQYPKAIIHHSPNEVPLQGKDVARAISKAVWNGMLPGFPDLVVVMEGGVLFLEVKSESGKLTDAQRRVGEAIEASGNYWKVVRSVDGAKAAIMEWRNMKSMGTVPFRGVIS